MPQRDVAPSPRHSSPPLLAAAPPLTPARARLRGLDIQALPAAPHSVCLLPDMSPGGGESTTAGLHLNIGLSNGVLVRTIVDRVKGTLSHTRTQFLGSRAVRCVRLALARSAMGEEEGAEGEEGGGAAVAVLACSSRPWLVYEHQRRELVTPLSYATLEHASNFTSEQCADGIVAISGSEPAPSRTLRRARPQPISSPREPR